MIIKHAARLYAYRCICLFFLLHDGIHVYSKLKLCAVIQLYQIKCGISRLVIEHFYKHPAVIRVSIRPVHAAFYVHLHITFHVKTLKKRKLESLRHKAAFSDLRCKCPYCLPEYIFHALDRMAVLCCVKNTVSTVLIYCLTYSLACKLISFLIRHTKPVILCIIQLFTVLFKCLMIYISHIKSSKSTLLTL